jgi:lipid-binding SYLF domain-containing protein
MFIRIFSVAALIFSLAACTTTAPDSRSDFQKRREIDSNVSHTLTTLYSQAKGSQELVAKAKGVLVFPSVLSAGFVVGGEYGEGALRMGDKHGGYYKTTAGSIGFQAGAQSKSIVLLFMTQEALDRFVNSKGWTIGLDANVALFNVGADGSVTSETARAPVVGFVMTNGGLMFNVSLQGAKISPLDI